jgi:hypothetical protein
MLNDNAAGVFKAAYTIPDSEKTCRSCHDQGGMLENTRGMMDCGGSMPVGRKEKIGR